MRRIDRIYTTPSYDYKLTLTMNGKTKNIIWNEGPFPNMTNANNKDSILNDRANFLNLVKYINDYIYSTDEYKKMPASNGGYD